MRKYMQNNIDRGNGGIHSHNEIIEGRMALLPMALVTTGLGYNLGLLSMILTRIGRENLY